MRAEAIVGAVATTAIRAILVMSAHVTWILEAAHHRWCPRLHLPRRCRKIVIVSATVPASPMVAAINVACAIWHRWVDTNLQSGLTVTMQPARVRCLVRQRRRRRPLRTVIKIPTIGLLATILGEIVSASAIWTVIVIAAVSASASASEIVIVIVIVIAITVISSAGATHAARR